MNWTKKNFFVLAILLMVINQHAFSESTNNVVIKPGESTKTGFSVTANETVTKFRDADIVLTAKVISIERDQNNVRKLQKKSSKNNHLIRTRIQEYEKIISHLSDTNDLKIINKKLKDELYKNDKEISRIESELRLVSDEIMIELRKEIRFQNSRLITNLKEKKKALRGNIISITQIKSDLYGELKLLEVKKLFILHDIRAYKREIEKLSYLYINPDSQYESEVKVSIKVVSTHKGKFKINDKVVLFVPYKTKSIGLAVTQQSFGNFLYSVKLNDLVTIFYDKSKNTFVDWFISTDIIKVNNMMKRVKSGKFKDFIAPILD